MVPSRWRATSAGGGCLTSTRAHRPSGRCIADSTQGRLFRRDRLDHDRWLWSGCRRPGRRHRRHRPWCRCRCELTTAPLPAIGLEACRLPPCTRPCQLDRSRSSTADMSDGLTTHIGHPMTRHDADAWLSPRLLNVGRRAPSVEAAGLRWFLTGRHHVRRRSRCPADGVVICPIERSASPPSPTASLLSRGFFASGTPDFYHPCARASAVLTTRQATHVGGRAGTRRLGGDALVSNWVLASARSDRVRRSRTSRAMYAVAPRSTDRVARMPARCNSSRAALAAGKDTSRIRGKGGCSHNGGFGQLREEARNCGICARRCSQPGRRSVCREPVGPVATQLGDRPHEILRLFYGDRRRVHKRRQPRVRRRVRAVASCW